jgi:hypothetical protein
MKDFEDVARELDLDLTSWFVQRLPQGFWEGFHAGNEIYNVSHRRAQRVWALHHEFFKQFDVIVTSDTAPLSRIFLQNGWRTENLNRSRLHKILQKDSELQKTWPLREIERT